jgi:hypothetical protein
VVAVSLGVDRDPRRDRLVRDPDSQEQALTRRDPACAVEMPVVSRLMFRNITLQAAG